MPADNKPFIYLAPQHRTRLTRSGIIDTVANARRYETVEKKADIEKLGFSRNQCVAPALAIPLYNHLGQQVGVQIRPDKPRLNREAKPVKYESPPNSRSVIDVPPATRKAVLDPTGPLVITEGVIKADAAASKNIPCVSVAGVYSWRPDDPFWTAVPLRDRPVYVAFDSDLATNPNVRKAAVRLHAELREHGAVAKVLCLPAGRNGEKQGLDDFLAGGGTFDDLLALPVLEEDAAGEPNEVEDLGQYRTTPHGLVREIVKQDEVISVPLTNFNAWITADVEIDDGSEVRHELEITVELHGVHRTIQVPAEEFERMNWVVPKLGGTAIVSPTLVLRDHARAAIQSVSGAIPLRRLYEHLGWVKIGDRWVFLHAGGAIGGNLPDQDRSRPIPSGERNPFVGNRNYGAGPIGPLSGTDNTLCGMGVRVPPALKNYRLPEPVYGDELKEAIRDTLFLLSQIAPPHLYLPLLAATFRVAVDTVDFSIHLVGRTNVGKTVLLGLFTQFFGAELHDRNLPGSWLSTSNSLLGLMSLTKNAILPIDDFVPAGSQSDIERANREADRVFRAQGNKAGRGRCGRDGTPKEGRSPQCLPISTGEDVPEGHSLNTRLLALEVKAGDVLDTTRFKALTLAQKEARRGLFAKVMASFLAWLAPRYESERQELHEQKEVFRDVFRQSGRLARSVDIAADLLAGLDVFLDFCRQHEAVSEEQFESLWGQMHTALDGLLDEQRATAEEADPATWYLSLLITAFTTGYAHLKDCSNQVPPVRPELWGWKECFREVEEKEESGESVTTQRSFFVPQGQQIGWVTYDEVYLEITASLAILQRLARDSSLRPLPLTQRTLGRSLAAKKILTTKTEGHFTDKVTILGMQKRVLRIAMTKLVEFQGRAYTREKDLDELLDG